eukprot:SAG22_NODE_1205_length_5171_cov_8.055205_2_plen_65_part_00
MVFGADALDQAMGKAAIAAHLADPSMYHPFCAEGSRPRATIDVYNLAAFRYESLFLGIGTFCKC